MVFVYKWKPVGVHAIILHRSDSAVSMRFNDVQNFEHVVSVNAGKFSISEDTRVFFFPAYNFVNDDFQVFSDPQLLEYIVEVENYLEDGSLGSLNSWNSIIRQQICALERSEYHYEFFYAQEHTQLVKWSCGCRTTRCGIGLTDEEFSGFGIGEANRRKSTNVAITQKTNSVWRQHVVFEMADRTTFGQYTLLVVRRDRENWILFEIFVEEIVLGAQSKGYLQLNPSTRRDFYHRIIFRYRVAI